ncbi:MAG: bifunctional phosphoribosylaminoimidazolecarboxamide formyltransferase/IMP cyclohydrolase [Planctomycetia bacterium]|nr:bifunctional phosphoribosylaminoimidazolecarboxamide formyltransferase/IMP cyclohydrolase [Planctomycetia bacterium]
MESPKIKRSIISVSDKTGLDIFARGLAEMGVEIYSTGGTGTYLESLGIHVHDISSYTGFPEMMDGRLKTLHPKVFGGLLCRHDREDDMTALAEHQILTFELIVVNLYPFQATIARPDVTAEQAIEKIDIGGPSLVRAASKNHLFTTIATDPSQYATILECMKENAGTTTFQLRQKLAAAAFDHTAKYDRAIADWFSKEIREKNNPESNSGDNSEDNDFPETLTTTFIRLSKLRYGENPHQMAAVYKTPDAETRPSVVTARQLHGKELSYNNLMDLDAALAIVMMCKNPAVSVIKHNNPCGAAEAETLSVACQRALEGDPLSAFGSVLGINRTVDADTAKILCEPGLFVEAIIAEDFTPEALEMLTTLPKWKKNVRLMAAGDLTRPQNPHTWRYLEGGLLVQNADIFPDPESEWKVVTEASVPESMMEDMRFGWKICRFVKSNAIVLAKNRMLLGAGAGQMSRVDSVEIAIQKAGDRIQGAVMASDAFFPFPDSIEHAHTAGITAIIQPGGSVRDQEVIDACNKYGIAMIFTGRRHFKH